MIYKLVFISFCIFINLPHPGDAVKCWVCDSSVDPRCADPFDDESFALLDCSHKRLVAQNEQFKHTTPNVCRKIQQKVSGKVVISRDCALDETLEGFNKKEAQCFKKKATGEEVCTCKADGCNHGSNVLVHNLLIIVSTGLSILLIKSSIL